ncbi:helix-turn-helix domain-containing protein [Sinorhizobium meliloti]|uniref:helix-turn-helix domain-containing protein n=1 Tax=Rhizobium meliloti TaxID=382 RepID=UPI0029A17444|nr:hypothetical protein [Sinorhizobium meliloti]
MQAQPELMRQHEAYKAVRERLFRMPKPDPVPIEKVTPQLLVLRDYDAHVLAWRKWLAFKAAINASSTSTTIKVSLGNYGIVADAISLRDEADQAFLRRPMKEICLEVLQDFPGVTFDEVRGRHRSRNIVAARQACMYAIYMERKDVSFPRLGHFFGGRDHTTALHSVRKVEAQRAKESA